MSLDEYKAEVNRICAGVVRQPRDKRLEWFKNELAKLPPEYKEFTEQLVASTEDLTEGSQGMKTWEKVTMITSGLALIAVLLCLAVLVPEPTDFQIFVFRIVLAIGASAFACVIPGFLNIESRSKLLLIRAGGALAVFVLIYILNPPQLAKGEKTSHSESNGRTNNAPQVVETNK